jgi:hypothetical protein
MKAKVYKDYYCFEYAYHSWTVIDSPYLSNFYEAWSDTIYAASASKARYKAWTIGDFNEPYKEMFSKIYIRRKSGNDLVENPRVHPLIEKISKAQLDKMFHAVGASDQEITRLSFYRNRYVIDFDSDWEGLIQLGLAWKRVVDAVSQNMYYVSEEGMKLIQSMLPIYRWQFDNMFNSSTSVAKRQRSVAGKAQ